MSVLFEIFFFRFGKNKSKNHFILLILRFRKNKILKKMQSLFENLIVENIVQKIDIQDAEIILHSNFYDNLKSKFYFEQLKNNIAWQQDKMNIYGKDVNFPRLTAWYGDNDKSYSFSGITLQPKKWTDELIEIKNDVEKITNTKFNSVLLNYYRNEKDSISWHSDAEKELGKNPIIASVTFGETRNFQLKHKYNKDLEIVNINLTNGSLLIMQDKTQHFWLHQIPKSTKKLNERINLTFRNIL